MSTLQTSFRATAIALFAFFSLLVSATPAGLEAGYYTPETLGSLAQPLPSRPAAGAAFEVAAYPLYAPKLAPGAGRELVESYCSTCHSTRYITMQPPLPAATWEAEVHKMIQVFGMPIPEDASPQIIHYLQTHYTAETRKR